MHSRVPPRPSGARSAGDRRLSFRTLRLSAVERELDLARRALEDLWSKARPADRLCAVDRLLRDGALEPDVASRLRSVHDAVHDAWLAQRAARCPAARPPVEGAAAALQLEIAERARDSLLREEGLFEPLFVVAEGYVRSAPRTGKTFRDLWHARAVLVSQPVPFTSARDDDAFSHAPSAS